MNRLLLFCRILKFSGWLLILLGMVLVTLGLKKAGFFKDRKWIFWKEKAPMWDAHIPQIQLLPDPRAKQLETILNQRTASHDGWTESVTGGEYIYGYDSETV